MILSFSLITFIVPSKENSLINIEPHGRVKALEMRKEQNKEENIFPLSSGDNLSKTEEQLELRHLKIAKDNTTDILKPNGLC